MKKNGRKRIRWGRILLWICVVAVTAAAVWILLWLIPDNELPADSHLEESIHIAVETENETEHVNVVPRPEIDEQLLTINDYSRPGKRRKQSKKS